MALTLEITKGNGMVIAHPMTQAKTRISVMPGDTVRIIDASTGRSPVNLRVKRIGDSLLVDGLEDGQVVDLSGFYGLCTPEASCALAIENGSLLESDPLITPESRPIALLADGQMLMYGADPAATSLAPAAGGGMAMTPATVGGALLGVVTVGVAAAGGGGGGGAAGAGTGANGNGSGTGSQTSAPPVIEAASQTTTGAVQVRGTARAGETIEVRLGDVSREAIADADGRWSVTFERGTLANGAMPLTAQASGADGGHGSATAEGVVSVDLSAPAAPVVEHVGSGRVVNAAALADSAGFEIRGHAEPGSQVVVRFGNVTYDAVQADAQGGWVLTVRPGSAVPADGTGIAVTATAADAFGNVSAASPALPVDVDSGVPAAVERVSILHRTLSGQAEPGAAILVDLGSNGAPGQVTADLTAHADAQGAWSIDVPTAALAAPMSIVAQDAAGNAGGAVSFTPPVVRVGGVGATTLSGGSGSDVLVADGGGGLRNGHFQFWDLRDTSSLGGANRSSGWGGEGFAAPASIGWSILSTGASFDGSPAPVHGADDPDSFGAQVMGSYFVDGFGVPGRGTDGHSFVAYAFDGNGRSQGWDTSILHEFGGSGIEQIAPTAPGASYALSIAVAGLDTSQASFKVYVGTDDTPLAVFDGTLNAGVGGWTSAAPTVVGSGDAQTWTWNVTGAAGASGTLVRIETFNSTSAAVDDPGVRVLAVDLQATAPGVAQTIAAGGGADVLYGRGGDDILYGGAVGTPDAARDTFVHSMQRDNGHDVIKDFDVARDRIALIDVLDVAGTSRRPDASTADGSLGDRNLGVDDLGVAGGQRLVVTSALGADLRLELFDSANHAIGSVTLEGVATSAGNDSVAELIASHLLVLTSDGLSHRLLADASPQGLLLA
ncbi:MAG: Ig-like domain-containing protein [Burkholderiaceae bacterium]